MTQTVRLAAMSPDLRFALAGPIAYPAMFPRLGEVSVAITSCVPAPPAAPAYLRYADRDATLAVDPVDEEFDLEEALAGRIRAIGQSGKLDDLALTVVVLDVVDSCFRESGLLDGNIYLVDEPALIAALEIAGAGHVLCLDPVSIMRELAALELAYLFPVASKFRAGMYDGQVQYRLNGWGLTLARRLAVGRTAEHATGFRRMIGLHLAAEYQEYALYLRKLDDGRRESATDLLFETMLLPIPVLV
jgi:hypothetical protein